MAKLIGIMLLLLFAMCFSIYNWWFQHEKYKRLMDNEKKKLSVFNSPIAWGLYSIMFLLTILGITVYLVYNFISKVMVLQ